MVAYTSTPAKQEKEAVKETSAAPKEESKKSKKSEK